MQKRRVSSNSLATGEELSGEMMEESENPMKMTILRNSILRVAVLALGATALLAAGVGIGIIFGKVIEAVTRQPEMRDEITSIQWLGFALTEATFFYGLVAGLLSYVLK